MAHWQAEMRWQAETRDWINGQQWWIRRPLIVAPVIAAGGGGWIYACVAGEAAPELYHPGWAVLTAVIGLALTVSSIVALRMTSTWRRYTFGSDPPPLLHRAFVDLHIWLGMALYILILVITVIGIFFLVAKAWEDLASD